MLPQTVNKWRQWKEKTRRKKPVSDFKNETIKDHTQHGMSHIFVAKIVRQSLSSVTNYLGGLTNRHIFNNLKRTKKRRKGDKQSIVILAINLQQTATAINWKLKFKVELRWIQQILVKKFHIAFIKRTSEQVLRGLSFKPSCSEPVQNFYETHRIGAWVSSQKWSSST